jgi:hypothetical protein
MYRLHGYGALSYKLKQLVLMSLKCSPPIGYSPKIYADYVACFFEKEKRGVINIKLRPYYRFLSNENLNSFTMYIHYRLLLFLLIIRVLYTT